MKEDMKRIERLEDRVWSEIEQTQVSATTIKTIYDAVDILKDLSEIKKNCSTIEAMDNYYPAEEGAYNGFGRYPHYNGYYGYGSYDSYGRYPMRNPMTGRYMGADKDRMSRYLEKKMADATTDEERNILRGCMEHLNMN